MGTVYFEHNELSTLTAFSPESREGLHGRVSHAYLYCTRSTGLPRAGSTHRCGVHPLRGVIC